MTTHPSNLFSIATGSSEPIYRQLVDQAQRLVAGRQLAPGDAMPSVREVAQALALNPMTVSKAYGILELEGVLTRKRGMGMFVADAPKGTHSVASRIELTGRIHHGRTGRHRLRGVDALAATGPKEGIGLEAAFKERAVHA